MGLKVVYIVSKDDYNDVLDYVSDALDFYVQHETDSFQWDCSLKEDGGYTIKITING